MEKRKRPRMVVMIPLRRCGSNALRLRLNLNPHFYSPYPLHVTDVSSFFESKDLRDDGIYRQLIRDVIGLQARSLIPWPAHIRLDSDLVFDRLRDEPCRSIHRVVGELIMIAGEARGASVVMDKSQDSVIHFEDIVKAFPDVLFLDMVRDPRAQVCSMNQSILYDFETSLNLERWIESRRWVDRVRERYPDRVMTIRYEDFIADHETTLRRTCGFLGMPFCEEMLDITRSEEAEHMAALSPLWSSNFSSPNPYHVSKFKEILTAKEMEEIEYRAGEWMHRLGYSSTESKMMTIKRRVFEKEGNEERKKETWKKLAEKHPEDYQHRMHRMQYISSLQTITTTKMV